MSQGFKDKYKNLMKKLAHTFHDQALLECALTHRSAKKSHNERLEFLGDAILGYVISAELYQRHQTAKEGELSRMRAFLVNGEMLAKLGNDLGMAEYLVLGAGEKKNGAVKTSILADAVEAVIGAIYLDAGIACARQCVLTWYSEYFDDLSGLKPEKDAKSHLQECLQARQLPLPTYEATVTGQAHALTFNVVCTVEGLPYQASGESTSRRKAEQIAAKKYLELMNE